MAHNRLPGLGKAAACIGRETARQSRRKISRRKGTKMSVLNCYEIALEIFECDLDRDQAGIPPLYMPSVSRVLLASKELLKSIGMVPGAPEPSGWSPAVPPISEINAFRLERMADFEKPSRDGNRVLRAKRFGQLWAPQRAIPKISNRVKYRSMETLAFGHEEMPIWVRTYQAAMRLAEYYDLNPTTPVAGFWLPMFTCT
jgi:hypothetical protein